MSGKIKIIDGTEKQKNKDRKEQRGNGRYSEIMRAKWFFCALKLGYLQLICKDSLTFKSKFNF